MKYGLIGKKLSHSKSPALHACFGDYEYELCELDESELDDFFTKRNFEGINVTIPYKIAAMKYCDLISREAKACGCVNTVVKRADGTLYGDNTDWYGFYKTLEQLPHGIKNKKVLVFGTGGASLAVKYALRRAGAGELITISRSGENNYQTLNNHADAEILVNTTPLGTYPNDDTCPTNASLFPRLEGVIDLTYNPPRTRFIQYAEECGVFGICGLHMLVYQGLRASELFTGIELDDSLARKAYRSCLDDMLNIVLVGMPGCGKTTQGKRLAEYYEMDFIDTDEELEKKHGRSCSDIIKSCGEEYFRLLEADIIKQASMHRRTVISTGGGAVILPENRHNLRKCGYVIHLLRDLDTLATSNRPLSKSRKDIHLLWEKRKAFYEACSDIQLNTENDAETNFNILRRAIDEKNTRY